MCEDFHCLPSQAARELDRNLELVIDVMQLRDYARTKQQMDEATEESQVPKGRMAELVADIEFALYQARAARVAGGE